MAGKKNKKRIAGNPLRFFAVRMLDLHHQLLPVLPELSASGTPEEQLRYSRYKMYTLLIEGFAKLKLLAGVKAREILNPQHIWHIL